MFHGKARTWLEGNAAAEEIFLSGMSNIAIPVILQWHQNPTHKSPSAKLGCLKPAPISFVLWLHILLKMQVEKQVNNYRQNERDFSTLVTLESEFDSSIQCVCMEKAPVFWHF